MKKPVVSAHPELEAAKASLNYASFVIPLVVRKVFLPVLRASSVRARRRTTDAVHGTDNG